MIFITSPSKTQNTDKDWSSKVVSKPQFLEKVHKIAKSMKSLSKSQLQDLLDINDKLTDLNYERLQSWDLEHSKENSKPALLTYKGDIYKQIDRRTIGQRQAEYLQDKLRILSGFYGVLKPFDLIQPYRLEMGTDLKFDGAEDLYNYWMEDLTESLNSDLDSNEYLVNLASNEYYDAVNTDKIDAKVLQIEFRQNREGELKNYGIYAKKARGMMIDYAYKNNVEDVEELKGFNYAGYEFTEEKDDSLFFVKEFGT